MSFLNDELARKQEFVPRRLSLELLQTIDALEKADRLDDIQLTKLLRFTTSTTNNIASTKQHTWNSLRALVFHDYLIKYTRSKYSSRPHYRLSDKGKWFLNKYYASTLRPEKIQAPQTITEGPKQDEGLSHMPTANGI